MPLHRFSGPDYDMLSADAQRAWARAYVLAAWSNADGLLMRDGKPVTQEYFLGAIGVSGRKAKDVLRELYPKFISRLPDGTFEVVGWIDDQLDDAALRKRRSRQGVSSRDSHALILTFGCDSHTQNPQIDCDKCRKLNGFDEASLCDSHASPSHSPLERSRDTGSVAKAPSPVAPQASPPWVEDLRRDVRAMADVTLSRLSFEQRMTLGQYAAWRWSGYTDDEKKNRNKAGDFATQIEGIGALSRFADRTVREFITAGDIVWTAIGMRPLHSLWRIKAALGEAAAA